MAFNDENFMLNSRSAIKLYNEVAKEQPIYDFHCHLDPQAIYEDKPYENIVDLWLTGDHYKYRLMRSNGVAERYITGDAPKEEKFQKYCETIEFAFGSPLYHWSHLELRDVFGIDDVITSKNWQDLYDRTNAYLAETKLSPRKLLEKSRVRFVGTTDHPLDDLEWHAKIREDESIDIVVAPTFRPDEAYVSHANFANFTKALADKTGVEITDFASFIEAMENRIKFFQEMGAKASDISFDSVEYTEGSQEELDAIFQKAVNGEELSEQEVKVWQTGVFVELCGLYKEYGFVTQVHFGAIRNNNTKYSSELGADMGFDSLGDQTDLGINLNTLLDRLSLDDKLPKMIWYPLNPAYNNIVANALQNYQANEEGIKGQLQFGAAWWFADTKLGMIDQMEKYAEQGLFNNFLGMLTDSRSFMSFQRHDYFRRLFCSFIGDWVEKEEIPDREDLLRPFVEGICYTNAKNFFEG